MTGKESIDFALLAIFNYQHVLTRATPTRS
jgi:hypothetical protein